MVTNRKTNKASGVFGLNLRVLGWTAVAVFAGACIRKTHADVGPFVVGAGGGLTATVTPVPCLGLGPAVDDVIMTWGTYGDASWYCETGTTYSGGDAAQGGNVVNSQYTVLDSTVSGAGNITFYWKVSSELGYDYLDFYVDGVIQNSISGTVNWAYQSYAVGGGAHLFEWVYSKDSTVSSGSDTGWVDAVTFP